MPRRHRRWQCREAMSEVGEFIGLGIWEGGQGGGSWGVPKIGCMLQGIAVHAQKTQETAM